MKNNHRNDRYCTLPRTFVMEIEKKYSTVKWNNPSSREIVEESTYVRT